MKHIEIPNEMSVMIADKHLEHGDKLIYAHVRRYMNKDTRECYPSQANIANKLKCSRNRITLAMDRLVDCGLLIRTLKGKKNIFTFPETEFDKTFEMFTDEFLDMDLDLNVKEFYMDIQQYLYGKDTGIGRCSLPNSELSRLTGWSVPSIKKYKKILIEKDLLTEEETDSNNEYGLPIMLQKYNLTGLNQAALWVKAVTQQVTKNTEDIESIKLRLDALERENALLKKQAAFNRNSFEEINAWPM